MSADSSKSEMQSEPPVRCIELVSQHWSEWRMTGDGKTARTPETLGAPSHAKGLLENRLWRAYEAGFVAASKVLANEKLTDPAANNP